MYRANLIVVTEPTVVVSVRINGAVFLPKKKLGDVLFLQLGYARCSTQARLVERRAVAGPVEIASAQVAHHRVAQATARTTQLPWHGADIR